jgi:multidrug efflux pump subunit AcrA (membrane-fusion protein)
VRDKSVDVGEFVSRGVPVARLYSVDFAEVRLPLPSESLALIYLPLDYRGESTETGPAVTLRASYAGRTFEWSGRIVRTEGEIDPRTRMIHAVARVRDPYARGSDKDRPPLAAGLFVEAVIHGRVAKDVAVIPRTALREGDRVLVVDPDDRIRAREVTVLRTDHKEAVISAGLEDGDRVCTSALVALTDGTKVRTMSDEVG